MRRLLTLAGLMIGAMLSMASLAACQTSAFKSFSSVRTGMNKASVLELVGNPTKAQRVQGRDRWIYEFQDRNGDSNWREIQFEQGRVVYTGAPTQAKTPAAEQDRINESIVADEARIDEEARDRRDRELGAFRPKKNPKDEKLDALDYKMRESLYGLPANPEIEKRKFAPVFEPVK